MITQAYASTVYGVQAQIISIEVNIISGTKLFIVGLPDNAIKESEHRIESVLKQLKKRMPRQRVIVNLAPASLRKEGSFYDLPIALGILQASGQESLPELDKYLIMGELSLDGTLRPVRGVLPIAMEAAKRNFKGFILPKNNAYEASIVKNLHVIPVQHIRDAIDFLNKKKEIAPLITDVKAIFSKHANKYKLDLADVKGQALAKRSVEVAAAGAHNLLMIGPPGAGKTMLAKRIPSILPLLTLEEALETSRIYSVVGQMGKQALMTHRPFKAPHHTISDVALVGGGSIPQPGQISLTHNGLLFLDELPEFRRSTLEVLRQPLEEKEICITRAKLSVRFPANFMLVASMNPCPCGYYTHPEKSCTCTPLLRRKYMSKISGPLLDRIDVHMYVDPVGWDCMTEERPTANSTQVRNSVARARAIQNKRFANNPDIHTNSMMSPKMLQHFCLLTKASNMLLKEAMEKLSLSARAYNIIRKLARTIADLADSEKITEEHIAEAISYRDLDREHLY